MASVSHARAATLGCIADDYTGATDLATALTQAGMRTVLHMGLPSADDEGRDVGRDVGNSDAIVIALKSRTAPREIAVAESLAACKYLRAQGMGTIYFKVCSTFDSTAQGNIGPVAEALRQALAASFVPVTPASPELGRTVYQGHLFVGSTLLAESSMRHHPLTPMTDSNLVRVLATQLPAGIGVAHVARADPAGSVGVEPGFAARIVAATGRGEHYGIVDAIDDADLQRLAAESVTNALPLLVGGSGFAAAMPKALGVGPSTSAGTLPRATGSRAIISGSCSAASNAQVAHFLAAGGAGFALDPIALKADSGAVVASALAWAEPRLGAAPVLIYATNTPDKVASVQEEIGRDAAGPLVENALAAIAQGLVVSGVRQLLVAGGETSGACINALGIRKLLVGPKVDPGVPWCYSPELGLHIALKSGNFGRESVFGYAFEVIE
jgi:3-dehydrotetronate 4-kinase